MPWGAHGNRPLILLRMQNECRTACKNALAISLITIQTRTLIIWPSDCSLTHLFKNKEGYDLDHTGKWHSQHLCNCPNLETTKTSKKKKKVTIAQHLGWPLRTGCHTDQKSPVPKGHTGTVRFQIPLRTEPRCESWERGRRELNGLWWQESLWMW